MKVADPFSYPDRPPTTRAAPSIEPLSVRWQIIPREDPKGLIKKPLPLVRSQVGRALGEGPTIPGQIPQLRDGRRSA